MPSRTLCIRMKFRSFRNSLDDVSDMFRNLEGGEAWIYSCVRRVDV